MKYTIFPKELKRRQMAFASLAVSLFIGVILAALVFSFKISITSYIVFGLFLVALAALFSWYFRYLTAISFTLSGPEMERTRSKKTETYLIADITGVKLILRTDKTIRGLHLAFRGGNRIYVNGLENPETFKKELLNSTSKDVAIRESREPLAFDHPVFYPILGVILGFLSVFVLKAATNLNGGGARNLLYGILGFTGTVGLYFILAKPMSGSSNTKSRWDYGFGILLIAIAIVLYFLKT